ncbi:unnamed protein product [Echinostoma caproni]|uniref:Histone-lysine N-methyltransferase n=1 Tax=Echinostoma caproni TaxID=27848 RepID=A0A183AN65_9TREM|nr:unnamed protein product [Echinostoma caproni]
MTTLLDAPCSTRDCVPDRSNLSQLSAFRSNSSHEQFSSTLGKPHDSGFDDDDDSGQITHFSPSSFKTPTKESSSPGSSELPSMPSEKSNSRGFPGECSSSGCPVFEVTDTERSASDCSLSPNTQRPDVVNGGIVSPALLRLEDTIDSVLEKLENGSYRDTGFPTVRVQPTTPCSPASHTPSPLSIPVTTRHHTIQHTPSPRQSPVAFTSSSWYPTSSEGSHSFYDTNGYQKYDAFTDVGRSQVPHYPRNTASLRAYETNPVVAYSYGISDTPCYPSSPFPYTNELSRIPEKYRHSTPRYSGSLYPVPGGNQSNRTFATPNYANYRFMHPSDQHCYSTIPYPPTNRMRTYHLPMDETRSYYSESPTMFPMRSQQPHGGIYPDSSVCDTPIHCDTRTITTRPSSSRYYYIPKDPCSTNPPLTSVSQNQQMRKQAYGMYNGPTDKRVQCSPGQIPASHPRVVSSPMAMATCSTNGAVLDANRSDFSPKSSWCSGSQLLADADKNKSINEGAKGLINQKRRLPCSVSVRGTKRRRMVSSKGHVSFISSTLTENLVRSLLLHNASQYLHDPVIHLPVTLCSPTPVPTVTQSLLRLPTLEKARVSDSDSEFDQSRNRKYSQFPMCLRSPKLCCSDDASLCSRLSQSVAEHAQYEKLLSDNFLIKAIQNASVRSSQVSYQLPSPSRIPPDESNDLFDHPSRYEQMSRNGPSPVVRLRQHLISSNPSQLVSTNHRVDSSPDYSELAISSETLDTTRYTTCSHCLMQILTPEDAIRWRLPDGDSRILFCSSVCFLAYQNNSVVDKRFISTPITPGTCLTSVTSLLSDKDRAVPVFLKKLSSSKWMRGCGKRSLYEKVNRRRHENQTSRIRELLGVRRVSWRWYGSRWRKFRGTFSNRKHHFQSGDTRAKSRSLQSIQRTLNSCSSNLLSTRSGVDFYPDIRICRLCHQTGDAAEEVAGRLLNYDFDVWLHLNCILWCYDTYETVSGSLVHVARSLKKAEKTQCTHCGLSGAGLPCFHSDCPSVYHVPCAHKIGCSFYGDRGMYCPEHDTIETSYPRLNSLAVDRRVFIARDEDAQVGGIILKVNQLLDATSLKHDVSARLRVGGLVLHNVGQLLPEQLSSGLYHNTSFIYPVGYSSTRIYWSYRHVDRRCRYHCRIEDSGPTEGTASNDNRTSALGARFVVEVDETGEPPDSFEDVSCDGVWQQILTRINEKRRVPRTNYLRIFQNYLIGEVLYGLTEPHIIRAIESLPGVDRLNNYAFKFGRLQLIQEMPLAINPTGCARSEPKLRTHVRRRQISEAHATQHVPLTRKPAGFHGTCTPLRSNPGSPVYLSSNSSMIQSKSQQYRRLGSEWKMNVVLARSRIQGLGLFAARDINKHTFIIEYLGELIRNEVGNRRERLYESQNRGVYMFRVDDDYIVDATMCGGLARYINHSCDPNCTAEVLTCDNGSHIVIIAKRNIEKGEELTYDYKFDIEEDRWDRIPCLCGASNCRQWMN